MVLSDHNHQQDHEQSTSENYVSKCASHISFPPDRRKICTARLREMESGSESDEDNNSMKNIHNPYFSKRVKKNQVIKPIDLNNLDNPGKSKAENDMILLAGGSESAQSRILQCEDFLKSGARRLEPRIPEGDTILMDKCIQKQPLSDKSFWSKNHAQIFAYARLMAKHKPALLVHRNSQNVSALDLAALNDKATIAVFLARILESQGFDPNAPNDQGHTVLHLLARKGDECAATLEALLSMVQENKNSKRLFRIDVVNHGHKTPLDVAVICAEMYSTGKDRAIYTETIKLFQDVIIDEANSFMDYRQ